MPSLATHVEVLVEDESTAVAVDMILQRLIDESSMQTWRLTPFRGKERMLRNLPALFYSLGQARYASKVVVVIDQDRDDCQQLKSRIWQMAVSGGLVGPDETTQQASLRVRIAMTELESWFLGDTHAIRAAYPRVREREVRVPGDVDLRQSAWEYLQRPLLRHRYFDTRMPKTIVAKAIAAHLDLSPDANASHSFRLFLRTLRETYGLA